MNTKIVPANEHIVAKGLNFRIKMRNTKPSDWLNDPELSDRLSGTLKKNSKYMNVNEQLYHEVICQVFGYGFESIYNCNITFNDALSEGDCHALTEAGYFMDRLVTTNLFDEDKYELKYLVIQDNEANVLSQGVGIILKETSAKCVRQNHLVYAMLTEYDLKTKTWSPTINPL